MYMIHPQDFLQSGRLFHSARLDELEEAVTDPQESLRIEDRQAHLTRAPRPPETVT